MDGELVREVWMIMGLIVELCGLVDDEVGGE